MISIKNALVGNRSVGYGALNDEWSPLGNQTIDRLPKQWVELPRKVYVGGDSTIANEIGDGFERIRDAILPFARGVDPMVGVQTQNADGRQAPSLPYKMGVFRPPIVRPSDLLPLSRMPRESVAVQINPTGPVDVSADHAIEERMPLNTVAMMTTAQARAYGQHDVSQMQLHAKPADVVSYDLYERNIGVLKVENPEYVSNLTDRMPVEDVSAPVSRQLVSTLPENQVVLPERASYMIKANPVFESVNNLNSNVGKGLTDRHTIGYQNETKMKTSLGFRPERQLTSERVQLEYTTQPTVRKAVTPVMTSQQVRAERLVSQMNVNAHGKTNAYRDRVVPKLADRALSQFSFENR